MLSTIIYVDHKHISHTEHNGIIIILSYKGITVILPYKGITVISPYRGISVIL
ncbi:hypothetical protein F383_25287 [Gossypium arboreum]|uniref:Uncharacterized protein n=1 Tax=Gossypium arboreum TaxID=29729 RepID=A0A0B0NVG4_GOSAR|nr:hypothetical protein F383_25287 [Gossypium arboreum]